MDYLRRSMLKQVGLSGGGVLLLGTSLINRVNGQEEGVGQGAAETVTKDVAAVRTATRDAILSMLDDESFDVHALYEALSIKSTIRVKNEDSQTWHVKISKACGEGQDGYWQIPPGHTEPWKRCVYHRVTMKLSEDRAHVSQSIDHTVAASTGCNYYRISGGRLVYSGPEDCL